MSSAVPLPPRPPLSPSQKRWSVERITRITPWSVNLWSLRITKPERFVFTPGHYARLGLPVELAPEQAPVWRAYSIVSAPHEDFLEFLVTLVPTGAMSQRLSRMQIGSEVLLEVGAMGFFVASQLAPGETLWMLSTGSGLGPYVSMLRDGGLLKPYRKLVVTHSVRTVAELAYADELKAYALRDASICYVPIVTREPGMSPLSGRIPHLIESHELENFAACKLDVATARVMVCGNPDFTADMRRLLTARGFQPCRRGLVGSMLFENYW